MGMNIGDGFISGGRRHISKNFHNNNINISEKQTKASIPLHLELLPYYHITM